MAGREPGVGRVRSRLRRALSGVLVAWDVLQVVSGDCGRSAGISGGSSAGLFRLRSESPVGDEPIAGVEPEGELGVGPGGEVVKSAPGGPGAWPASVAGAGGPDARAVGHGLWVPESFGEGFECGVFLLVLCGLRAVCVGRGDSWLCGGYSCCAWRTCCGVGAWFFASLPDHGRRGFAGDWTGVRVF